MTKPYMPPSLRGFTPQFLAFSTWIDHMPFGYDLIAALRPKLLVELGTQRGLSFFTFCQAMKEQQIDGLAYGVDTFEGDAHTKEYDDTVFKAVNQHARANFMGIAYLMKMYFSEALQHFDEGSIDLLHIDGLHTYEAVKEDFEGWYPRVKPGGIILFHDIRARLLDFGAWRFWDELEAQHESFAFNHGFGLGVLRKPGGDRSADSDLVANLFGDTGPDAGEALRALYVHAARHHDQKRHVERLEKHNKRLEMKLAATAAPPAA